MWKIKIKFENLTWSWGPIICLLIAAFFGIMQLQVHGYAKKVKTLESKPKIVSVVDQYNLTPSIQGINEKLKLHEGAINLLLKRTQEHNESIHYGH